MSSPGFFSRVVGRFRFAALLLILLYSAPARHAARAAEHAPTVVPAPAYDPAAPVAWDEAQKAIAHFKLPKDFKASVWAAEPQLLNPVAFSIDARGRVWIVESHRFRGGGVLDIRFIYHWVDEDLACRTVADRDAMVKRHWPDSWQELTKNPDRIRLLEDTSGSGRCDHAVIWADGFNDLADGIAAGVLERKGNVYFTDIPNLWMLRDTKGAGVSDQRTIMSTGYGVRYNFEGHDLHGLRFGPDGKLYFSCGDRGFSVKTKEGKLLDYPDTGGVLRCDPDGSNLELFCSGLRNPQKLCFDEHGNLFTGDNNSDHGDPAKWFYLVEGADCGWRVGYQHISKPKETGPLLMENIMATEKDSSVYYNTPPIAHIGNGPSGCTYYPGTGMPESFNGHFLLCDFRGGQVNSGVWAFTMKPKGASFEMENRQQYAWQILPTDVEFGTDGGFYVADWVNGWERPNKGRIYRFFEESAVKKPIVAETQKLLKEGMTQRNSVELGALLAHADQRVRQEAQFELADRGIDSLRPLTLASQKQPVSSAFDASRPDLAQLHGIWGIGQLARKDAKISRRLIPLLSDPDEEVRAQAAKVLGESRDVTAIDPLIVALKDERPRVQFFAVQALGKLENKAAIPALLDLLKRNGDKDAYIRHAAVLALATLNDPAALMSASWEDAPSVRLAILEVLRRWQSADCAKYLNDKEPKVVLEAARAINDLPIVSAYPALAQLIENPKAAEPVLRRSLNANFRLGSADNAVAVAKFAATADAPELVRIEAINSLAEWEKPSIRDHVMGLIWPLDEKTRDAKAASAAIRPLITGIIQQAPNPVRIAALAVAEKVGVDSLDPVFAIVADAKMAPDVRAAALKVLAAQHSPQLAEALKIGLLENKAAALRREAIRLQTTQPDAVAKLDAILSSATPADQQAVFATLPTVGGDAVNAILTTWLDKLLAGNVPAASTLDLLEAAAKSKSAAVKAKLDQFEARRKTDDALSAWRECLEGGDAQLGRKIFFEKQEVSCVRCHKIGKEGGGDVGPNLLDIGKRQSREYILESIVQPNAKIAPGFESAGVKLADGRFLVGVVKDENDAGFKLDTGADQGIVAIKKSDIKNRKPALSPMPEDVAKAMTKQELRDLVEYLASQKG